MFCLLSCLYYFVTTVLIFSTTLFIFPGTTYFYLVYLCYCFILFATIFIFDTVLNIIYVNIYDIINTHLLFAATTVVAIACIRL